jgi:hypothetical protein
MNRRNFLKLAVGVPAAVTVHPAPDYAAYDAFMAERESDVFAKAVMMPASTWAAKTPSQILMDIQFALNACIPASAASIARREHIIR